MSEVANKQTKGEKGKEREREKEQEREREREREKEHSVTEIFRDRG